MTSPRWAIAGSPADARRHDDDDVAVDCRRLAHPGEEAPVRRIAADNIAPHLTFVVHIVACEADASRGYYLLIVPPSTLQPHAVRKDRDLRYPLRDGTTTRWLSEPEVADMYRGRFAMAVGLAARLDPILAEGLAAMDLTEEAFVAVALVQLAPGPCRLTSRGSPPWAHGPGTKSVRRRGSRASSRQARRLRQVSPRIA